MLMFEQVKFLEGFGWPCYMATCDRDEFGCAGTVRLYLAGFSQPGEQQSARKMFSGANTNEAYLAAVEFVMANPRKKAQPGQDGFQRLKDALQANALARQNMEVSSSPAVVEDEPVDPLDGL